MNQKIAELKKRAIVETVEHYSWGDPAITHHLDIEKFAELIIRECDRYVAERFDECEPWMSPGDLLKHFEVK